MADPIPGFHQLSDQVLRGLVAENAQVIAEAAQAALQAHNTALNDAFGRLTFRTTQHQAVYKDNTRSGELQPLDEYGRAVPRRVRPGTEYSVGLPLIGAGDAVGQTYLHKRSALGQDVNNTIADFQNSDINWRYRQALSAFFQKNDWTFRDERYGDLNVVGLANGDPIRYPVMTSAGAKSDNHLFAQAAAISATADPFPALVAAIKEHPQNTGDVMVFCSTAQLADIEDLPLWYEYTDPAVTFGIAADRLTATAPIPPFGAVKGYLSGRSRCWIVEWDRLNDVGTGNYLIVMTVGGPRPVAQRIPLIAGLGDLGPLDDRDDFPYYQTQYGLWTGFGAWNRIGAAILQVGSATYTVPAGYERVG